MITAIQKFLEGQVLMIFYLIILSALLVITTSGPWSAPFWGWFMGIAIWYLLITYIAYMGLSIYLISEWMSEELMPMVEAYITVAGEWYEDFKRGDLSEWE